MDKIRELFEAGEIISECVYDADSNCYYNTNGFIADGDHYQSKWAGFQKGYKAARASQWISVADKLPEITYTDDSPCMLNGQEVPPAHRSDAVLVVEKGVVRIKRFEWLGDKLISEYTHWMPLPEGPTE